MDKVASKATSSGSGECRFQEGEEHLIDFKDIVDLLFDEIRKNEIKPAAS